MNDKKLPLKLVFNFEWLGKEPQETEKYQLKNTGVKRYLTDQERIDLVKLGFACSDMIQISHALKISVFSVEQHLGSIAMKILNK